MNPLFYGILFLVSTGVLWIHLLKPKRFSIRWPQVLMGTSLFLLSVQLLFMFMEKSLVVPTTAWERQLTLTVILGFVAFGLSFYPARLSLSFVIFAVLGFGLLGLALFSKERPLEALPSPWLASHIVFTLLGEALFFLASTLSFVYLLAESLLRKKKVNHFLTKISSLPEVDRWTGDLLFVGFALLSLGILLGVVFAKQYWSAEWWVDAKVLFCLATWSYFAVILGIRAFYPQHMRGRRTAILNLIGFVGLLFVAWGVEMIFPSRHQDYFSSIELRKET